jgi:preprotein translocase subunit SecG
MITTLLYIVFVLAAIVLVVVVLLQEGKGGGFGQFLGEGGQQTFGVGAKGINTFTGYTAATFLVSALLLHYLNNDASDGSLMDDTISAPVGAPASPGGTGAPMGVPDGN